MSKKPNKVRFDKIKNTTDSWGVISYFECSCGNEVVSDRYDDTQYVEVHGCGRDHLEVVHCDVCDTTWRSEWIGITFSPEVDNE